MDSVALSNGSSVFTRGEIQLVDTSERSVLVECAEQAGLLVVELVAPGPAWRGQLALLIDESIEDALSRRGAAPPGIGASANLDASLSDQLYRARLVERRGLTLSIPSLHGVAGRRAALDAEDSAVLRWWMAATRERPVRLIFDVEDRGLGIYGAPEPFEHVFASFYEPGVDLAGSDVPEVDPELSASAAAMELSAMPPKAEHQEWPAGGVERDLSGALAAVLSEVGERFGRLEPDPRQLCLRLEPEPVNEFAAASNVEERPEGPPAQSDGALESLTDETSLLDKAWDETPFATDHQDPPPEGRAPGDVEEQQPEHAASPDEPEEVSVDCVEPEIEPSASAVPPPVEATPPPVEVRSGFMGPRASEPWRTWLRELDAARGPKPLAVVERMFVSNYVPLRDAMARGLEDPKVAAVTASWGASFAQSYSDAFDALRLRGKRPTMVLDVPDIALRIARLHGARSVHLILVDAMRFDLGLRVQDRLRPLLGQRAALTERLLLWSALPANTTVQLELIGQGPKGLRELPDGCGSEVPVARGRVASTLRRIKAGHRELMKLDLVEAKLGEPGGPPAERLDALADEVAEVLHQHLVQLPPRTLAMVFGDHGFVLNALDNGTSAARHGGASPEEILVPAFAWLIGNVH